MTEAVTPGHVMAAPTRTTTRRARVKRSRVRSSGILKVLENALITSGEWSERLGWGGLFSGARL
jgi:hypothetical protein